MCHYATCKHKFNEKKLTLDTTYSQFSDTAPFIKAAESTNYICSSYLFQPRRKIQTTFYARYDTFIIYYFYLFVK